METLQNVKDVIAELGGVQEVARLTGRKRTAVCNWKLRERMASATYPLMIRLLEAKGKSAPPELWGAMVTTPEEKVE